MEFRQLQYFQTVAELEHMTQAAAKLHVAQSAISRQIKLLEDELGIPLFYRDGTGIRLTTFGKRFLPLAGRILRDAETALREADVYRNPDAGTVRLGFPHSVGVHYVPTLLAKFRELAPGVKFDLVQDRVQKLVQGLGEGDLDLAIITPWERMQSASDFLTGTFLYEEEMFAIVHPGHRFAKAEALDLADLQDEPFVLFKPGYTLRTVVVEACEASGFSPRIAFEAEETDTVKAFVQAGLGVSVLPVTKHDDLRRIRAIRLRNGALRRTVGMVWHKHTGLHGAAERFARFAAERSKARPADAD